MRWQEQLAAFYQKRWDAVSDNVGSSRVDQTVVTDTPLEAKRDHPLMIVGEAPGGEEVRLGRPFVGPAGRNLKTLLEMAGLDRTRDLLVTNGFPFRTFTATENGVKNRTPDAKELALGADLLAREIRIVQPRMILLLGGSAKRAASYLPFPGWKAAIRSAPNHSITPLPPVQDLPPLSLGVTFHTSPLVYNIPAKRQALEQFFRRLG